MTDNRGGQAWEIADPTNREFEAEFWRRDGEELRHVVLGLYIYIFCYSHRRLSRCCLCTGAMPPPVWPLNWWKLCTSFWRHSQREDEQPSVSRVGATSWSLCTIERRFHRATLSSRHVFSFSQPPAR